MSKNIDEIVEEILPMIAIYVKYVGDKVYVEDVQYEEKSLMNQATCNARTHLKQALTEKKLVVPLSEEKIFAVLYSNDLSFEVSETRLRLVAEAIYERQFKGDE
jgi:thiamine phosphate synthase YjbQ (UPF0047 family)